MAIEEDTLALLEQGRLAGLHTEDLRQARYAAEDDARIVERKNEDLLRDEGDAVREAKVAEMKAAIAARGQTPEAQIAAQNERIDKLEAMVEAASKPPLVVHEPDEPKPLV